MVSNILKVWHQDGVPDNIPMLIAESNISSNASEASVDIFGALWLADYVGAFLTAGGNAIYYFHYIPFGVHPGCNNSDSTLGMFATDNKRQITQPVAILCQPTHQPEMAEARQRRSPALFSGERH